MSDLPSQPDRSWSAAEIHRSILPFRPTLRIRLTMFYGGMFLLAGLVMVLVMYVFVSQAFHLVGHTQYLKLGPGVQLRGADGQEINSDQYNAIMTAREAATSSSALHTLLLKSISALIALLILAVAFGYAMAGRVLQPIGRITRTARQVASSDMHRRIEMDGPDDELKELADTFDEMLERLDRSFESQRKFVANASHELRTPLAINRTLLEVQLSDPESSPDLQQLGKTLLATNERSEQLVEGLLLLARSDNELVDRRPVDLAEVARQALEQTRSEAAERGVRLEDRLEPAVVSGNGVLLERIALNLIQNAVRYNLAEGGWVRVSVGATDGVGELQVSNTGQMVPGYELEHIFEPFRRGSGKERTRSDKGVGLGLSIVRSVVRAHGGTIEASGRPEGGLDMRVRIPIG
ncbi:cell wall metabolism sensor histidine kinase WalK [Streptacidiphilus sp. P02-A3a]|uniref:sensor histidine kinase n=1 Tax=Streptacidiphilus sp. P02-A3a TaxID=2704468 RepID=UPI0015F95513|nr:HAMP domain-containing sensor histidine kinase [Streptacidiphilus sp. P02-A3a]QMU72165.1 HAMP domain-containing histidine kinase [Streptacidiphilus sp. P02-A3a]